MPPLVRAALLSIVAGAVLGLLILGVGGRLAMHAIVRLGGGAGAFTLGGTATVIGLGAAAGAVAGFVLFVVRVLFARWPAVPPLLFWMVILAGTLWRLDLRDPLELVLFVPLGVAFGLFLQAASRRWLTNGAPAATSR